jgi:hypothetical protein
MNDELLDRQLREAAPYIDDGGFTAGVLSGLPAPRHQKLSLRAPILFGITLLGCVLAYVLSDSGRFIIVNLVKLSMLPMTWLLIATVASGILVTTAGCFAALAKTKQSILRY